MEQQVIHDKTYSGGDPGPLASEEWVLPVWQFFTVLLYLIVKIYEMIFLQISQLYKILSPEWPQGLKTQVFIF